MIRLINHETDYRLVQDFYKKNNDKYYNQVFNAGMFTYLAQQPFFLMFDEDMNLVSIFGVYDIKEEAEWLGTITLCVDKDHRQLGYGNDALVYITKIAFEQLKLRKVNGFVAVTNEPSQALFKKYFEIEGKIVKHDVVDGEYEDHFLYYRLNEDWTDDK